MTRYTLRTELTSCGITMVEISMTIRTMQISVDSRLIRTSGRFSIFSSFI